MAHRWTTYFSVTFVRLAIEHSTTIICAGKERYGARWGPKRVRKFIGKTPAYPGGPEGVAVLKLLDETDYAACMRLIDR